jgi:hypothetical protein
MPCPGRYSFTVSWLSAQPAPLALFSSPSPVVVVEEEEEEVVVVAVVEVVVEKGEEEA